MIPFSALSRYYFSAGHYAFRLVETIKAMGLDPREIGLRIDLLLQAIQVAANFALANSNFLHPCRLDQETKWWLLTGLLWGQLGPNIFDSKFFVGADNVGHTEKPKIVKKSL